MSNQSVSISPIQNMINNTVKNNVANTFSNKANKVVNNIANTINNASNKIGNSSGNSVLNAMKNVKESLFAFIDEKFGVLMLFIMMISIIFIFYLAPTNTDSIYEPILVKLNDLTTDNLQRECLRIKTTIDDIMKNHNEPTLYQSQIMQLDDIKSKLDKNKLSKKEMYLLYDTLKLMNEQIYMLQEKLENTGNSKMVIQDASKKIEIPVNKDSNIRNYFMKIKGNHLEDEKSYIQRLKSIENMYRNKIENMKTNSVIPQMSKDVLVDAANLAVEKDKFEELKRSSVNMSKRAQDNIQLAEREMKRIDGELFDMLYNKSRPHIEPKILMQNE